MKAPITILQLIVFMFYTKHKRVLNSITYLHILEYYRATAGTLIAISPKLRNSRFFFAANNM